METEMILFEHGEPVLDWSKLPPGIPVKVTDIVHTTGEQLTATLTSGVGLFHLADRMDTLKTIGLHEIVVSCGTLQTHTWSYRPRAHDPYRRAAVRIDWRMEGAYVLVQICSEVPMPKGRLRYRFDGCPLTFDLGYIPPKETRWASFYSEGMEPLFYLDDSMLPPFEEIHPERFARLGLGIELHTHQIIR